MDAIDPLNALSPLDGRYAHKVGALRPLWSEAGLLRHRVRVEVEWLITLSDAAMPELPPFDEGTREALRAVASGFSDADARAIKAHRGADQSRRQGGRILPQGELAGNCRRRRGASSSSTSPAPRKTSTTSRTALMLEAPATRYCCPRSTGSSRRCATRRTIMPTWRCCRVPTARRRRRRRSARSWPTSWRGSPRRANASAGVRLLGKMNGAVGNYNAHVAAYPEIDWPSARRAASIEDASASTFNPLTTRSSPTTGWPSCSMRWSRSTRS